MTRTFFIGDSILKMM